MTKTTRDDDGPDMDRVRRFLKEASHYIVRAKLEMIISDHPIREHIFDAEDAVFTALEILEERGKLPLPFSI